MRSLAKGPFYEEPRIIAGTKEFRSGKDNCSCYNFLLLDHDTVASFFMHGKLSVEDAGIILDSSSLSCAT